MSENKTIDKMAEQFNSVEEMKAYSNAQYKTILNQSKQIGQLQLENEKLKEEVAKLVKEATVGAATKSLEGSFQTSDEETTCVIQIAMIKQLAMSRELTLDETRKFEIFSKTLMSIRGKIEKTPEPTKAMSNEELLALMQAEMPDEVGN